MNLKPDVYFKKYLIFTYALSINILIEEILNNFDLFKDPKNLFSYAMMLCAENYVQTCKAKSAVAAEPLPAGPSTSEKKSK